MQRPIDRDEIDRLVLECLPNALRFALRLTSDPLEAEELVQETLLRVLKRWESYRSESSFRTWMMSILLNAHRDRLRRPQREEPLLEQPLSPVAEPIEQVAKTETAAKIIAEIDQLPTRQREVAVICLCEGLSPREAAEALNTTENNIHATLHSVRKRLAQAIGPTTKKPR